MNSSHSALFLLLLLGACGSEGEAPDCGAAAVDTLASARIDGRPLAVSIGAADINSIVILGGMGGTVSMIAYCPSGRDGEGMQFWLDGFHGVGAYPVTNDASDSTSSVVYWTGSVEDGLGYWGGPGKGDTVWVSSFDTLTREIEGSFSFKGGEAETEVHVTEGRYQGVVLDYISP